MSRIPQQRGFVLLPVVLLIALVAALAFLMNNQAALDSGITVSSLEVKQAEHVALAGLNHALWQTAQQGCGPHSDLTDVALDRHRYTTRLATDLGSTSRYKLPVEQDSWIRSDNPTDNKATDSKLHILYKSGVIERPMYRYDLSPLPANARILSATAWFYVSKEHPQGPLGVHLLTRDWLETDATWESMAANMDSAVINTIPAQPLAGVWVSVNLTAQVQAWVNGQPDFGIALNATSDNTDADYASREAAQQPYLEVIVGAAPTATASLESIGTLANGASRTITRNDVVLYQKTPMHQFKQLGAAETDDGWITALRNSYNFGADTLINVDEASGPHRGMIRFDVENALPRGARLTGASLELFANSVVGNGYFRLYGLHLDWLEGSCSGSCATAGVTWDTTDGTSAWTTPGGDADTSAVAEVQADKSGIWYSWDITAIARQWVTGERTNYGILVKGEGAGASFHGSDNADATTRPRLTLSYSCKCGQACTTPQGSGIVLLVVSDDINPAPAEVEKKQLFESWGYTVSLIDDGASQAVYDSALDISDVVYVSETAVSTQVGTRLSNTTVGIVNEEGFLYDELGIASVAAWPVGDSINITDIGHDITRVFTLGALSIYDANMEAVTVSGTLAPDLQTLAVSGGAGAVVVQDKGADLYGGGTAAGRRVTLPIGRTDTSNFDWNYINNNGLLLVHRAIEWAKPITCNDADYRDDFESNAFDNNDGSLSWSSDWIEVDANGAGAGAGSVRIQGGQLQLDDHPDTGGQPSASRQLNLDGASAAVLAFDYELGSSTDLGSDIALLEISPDGTGWVQLEDFSQWGGGASGSRVYDISAYLAPSTQLRFRITAGYSNDKEYLAIDKLSVSVCGTIKP